MNTKEIQNIKDNAYKSWFNINKSELMLKDWVFSESANNTGKTWIEMMAKEFVAATNKTNELEAFLLGAGVICAVENARKSEARAGYYQALASDKFDDKYMLWWKASDVVRGAWAQFEVQLI